MSSAAEIEKRLLEYRAKRAREEKINAAKSKINTLLSSLTLRKKSKENMDENIKEDEKILIEKQIVEEPTLSDVDQTSIASDDENINCCTYYDIILYVSLFLLWAVGYAIFIQLQFGTVFLIVSALIFMYVNTRTGPRKPSEISAYSVFNKNCESIDGTLKAEQFEREIRYGPSVVR